MKFSQMLDCLDYDVKMIRKSWDHEPMNTFIVKMPPLYLPPHNTEGEVPKVNERTAKHIGNDIPLDSQPYLAMFKDGKWYPGWLPSAEDLFATDWYRIKPNIYCIAGGCICLCSIGEPTIEELKEKFIKTVSDAQYSNDPEWVEEKNAYIKRLRESINIDRHIKSESDINEDDGTLIKHFQD